nr:uncharacterized protein CI109_007405 [Kwoniella shandongensis]KAA5524253.1 hypothetical protein CI109_007405 [Kwoniella shandongensis]
MSSSSKRKASTSSTGRGETSSTVSKRAKKREPVSVTSTSTVAETFTPTELKDECYTVTRSITDRCRPHPDREMLDEAGLWELVNKVYGPPNPSKRSLEMENEGHDDCATAENVGTSG